jgi:hypothetical protein
MLDYRDQGALQPIVSWSDSLARMKETKHEENLKFNHTERNELHIEKDVLKRKGKQSKKGTHR